MAILSFVIHLMSGATLLLFAVRFMRIGIERLWRERINRGLSRGSSRLSLMLKGTVLGFVMQGATVVMLMAAGLAGASVIPAASAVLLALGADFGSAIAVAFLSLPVSALGPLAILVGGWLYLNAERPERRNLGRVILGLGLIFLSLAILSDAVAPVQNFPGAASAVGYLNADPVTAAILGLALTFAMHSSLAAVLTGIAFATEGSLSPLAGVGVVLGCNIGSALLPLWLLRGQPGAGTLVAKTVAVLRVGLAAALLAVLWYWQDLLRLQARFDPVQSILLAHLGFNLLLLFLSPLAGAAGRLFAEQGRARADKVLALQDIPDDPDVVLSALRGGVSRMLDILADLFEVAASGDGDPATVAALENQMNRALAELRNSYAVLPDLPRDSARDVQTLMEFAIRIEACGDVVSGRYQDIRQEGRRGDYNLSPEGLAEIETLHREIRKGIHLAQSVFWQGEPGLARRLVEHKQNVTRLEEDSRRAHFHRLRNGNIASLGSSDHHLEMIAALKTVNSKLATIGYAVLGKHGGLKKTRLKSPQEL